jgi:hypothetical protein
MEPNGAVAGLSGPMEVKVGQRTADTVARLQEVAGCSSVEQAVS